MGIQVVHVGDQRQQAYVEKAEWYPAVPIELNTDSTDLQLPLKHRVLKVLLTIIAIGGMLLVAFVAVVLPFVSQVGALKPGEYVLIASQCIPFVFYLWVITKHATRRTALFVGIPIHALWLPLVYGAAEAEFYLVVLIVVAIPWFVLYVAFARSLPSTHSDQTNAHG